MTEPKLYPVQKLVTNNGQRKLQTYHVTLGESIKLGYQHHKEKKEGKDALTKLLRKVRKSLGSETYRDMIRANGITWKPSEHTGANTMRATISAYNYLMEGNELDIQKRTNTNSEVPVGTSQPPKDSVNIFKSKEDKRVENSLKGLLNKLGLPYSEKDGKFIIGEGCQLVENRWGNLDIATGSVRMSEIIKAPESLVQHWGNGNFIQLDSNFNDKEKIKLKLDGKFNPENKKWSVPFSQFIEVIKTFKNVEISSDILPTIKQVMRVVDINAIDLAKRKTITEADIDISDYVNPEGIQNLELYDFQKKSVKFLLENKKVILGLAVGLGKTPSSIVAVKQLINDGKIKRALVVAPSSVKFQWKGEIEKFSDMKVAVLESKGLRGRKAIESWKRAEDADVIIVNYEMLRKEEIRDRLSELAPDCVIADEAHKLKNSKAQQTKGFKLAWNKATYKFFLSATPFPNGKPQETHTILSHLRPEKVGSWKNFGKEFVEWERSSWGAKPVALREVDSLKNKMLDVVFMRTHNSPDVTTALPKERHTTFNLEMNTAQKKLYKAISDDITAELKYLESQGINATTPAMIAKLKRLEQVALDPDMLIEDVSQINMDKLYPKEEWAVQTITDHLEDKSNRGVVLFCDMKLPLEKIKQGLVNEGVNQDEIAFITGGVPPEERTEVQNKMGRGEVKVVLCTNAAEEGVNLQHGAHTLIHLDQPWTPKSISQREGRVLRTGQPNPFTNFYSPIMTGTVEDRKRKTLSTKVEIIEQLLGEGTAGSVGNNIKADVKSSGLTVDDLKNMIGH